MPGPYEPKYPFAKLEQGDSFLAQAESKRERQAIRSAASVAGKKLERTFVCRAVDGGVRVWRSA